MKGSSMSIDVYKQRPLFGEHLCSAKTYITSPQSLQEWSDHLIQPFQTDQNGQTKDTTHATARKQESPPNSAQHNDHWGIPSHQITQDLPYTKQ